MRHENGLQFVDRILAGDRRAFEALVRRHERRVFRVTLAIQSYSDRELFWIIKNGVRLSGMPAFAKVESDEHIWDLALYLRTLPGAARPNAESRNKTSQR